MSRRDYWQDPKAPKPTSRKPSASVFVTDGAGAILLLRRTDTGLWTIPTGGLKKGETISHCAIRECEEETGLKVEITGLVGVFSTPEHLIAYGDGEVRQPVNVCLRARVTGGNAAPTAEASDIRWVQPDQIGGYEIHPAILRRIRHGIESSGPHVD
ncbi:MAG TPA: NUDIX domain-containing protein [Streptosporangiaceae bacterium]|nr:NUDIX domain-containing protein [Streptosporangiaceae bacterium]